mgnify:FL=1|tara:strand:+ start:212 stop:589 length:378 start_codon:yes stop_codon:yes gene_type:complete
MSKKIESDKVQFARTNMQSIAYALSLVKKFRKIDDNVELLTVGIFSLVCMQEGITNSDICKYFDIPKARASRNLYILSKICKGRLGGKGLGLLEQKPDTKDFRIKTLHLTKRGQSVKTDLLALLG